MHRTGYRPIVDSDRWPEPRHRRLRRVGTPAPTRRSRAAVLTAARSGEVPLAAWDEMDVAGRVWTIPATRMKVNREHRGRSAGRRWRSSTRRGRSATAIRSCSRTAGATPSSGRSCRSSSSAWTSPPYHTASGRVFGTGRPRETDHPREVIETALAHVVRNRVEAAYARSDLFEGPRRLMDDWAEYLAGRELDHDVGQVVRAHPAGGPARHGLDGMLAGVRGPNGTRQPE